MTGPVKESTPGFGFNIINFDFARWHTYEWANWRQLDGILSVALGNISLKGVWEHNTPYLVGDRVTDATNGIIYFCLVNHISPGTGTFADFRAANPTYWKNSVEVPAYRGDWAPVTAYSSNDIINKDSAQYYICITPHTSSTDFLDDSAYWVLLFDAAGAIGLSDQTGQCRLEYDSDTQLKLVAHDGNKISINGISRIIPPSGVLLSNSGLGDGVYYIYAYVVSNIITLEASTTTFSRNTTTGIAVKSGDATRTLVGLARVSSNKFVANSLTSHGVMSYFNRRRFLLRKVLDSSVTTGATATGIISSDLSVDVLAFMDQAYQINFKTTAKLGTAGSAYFWVSDSNFASSGLIVRGTTDSEFFVSASFLPSTNDRTVAAKYVTSGQTLTFTGGAITGGVVYTVLELYCEV